MRRCWAAMAVLFTVCLGARCTPARPQDLGAPAVRWGRRLRREVLSDRRRRDFADGITPSAAVRGRWALDLTTLSPVCPVLAGASEGQGRGGDVPEQAGVGPAGGGGGEQGRERDRGLSGPINVMVL